MLFNPNHPVTLRWIGGEGAEVERRGRLHKITQIGLSVMLQRPIQFEDKLKVGDPVSAEAGEFRGLHLTVFRGSVQAIESRLVRIQVDGGIDVIQRRRFPRAKLGMKFATAIRLRSRQLRFFVAQPMDISGGGVRISHRLPLSVNDRFRLILRLDRETTVSPVARVVETWEQKPPLHFRTRTPVYVSRAVFVELSDRDRHLIQRYVFTTLKARN